MMGIRFYLFKSKSQKEFFIKIIFLEDNAEVSRDFVSDNFIEPKEIVDYLYYGEKAYGFIKGILDNDTENFEYLPTYDIYRIKKLNLAEFISERGIRYFLDKQDYDNRHIEEIIPISAKTAAAQTMKNSEISKIIEREKKNIYEGIRKSAKEGFSDYTFCLSSVPELKGSENEKNKKIFCDIVTKVLTKMDYECSYSDHDEYLHISWGHLIEWGK